MSPVDHPTPHRPASSSRWGAVAPMRRVALAVAFLFAMTSIAAFVAPTRTYAWDADSFSASSEAELVTLTNRARANAGLRSLKVDSTLTSVARWRSKDMIVRDYFSHTIPGYGKVWDKLAAIGYCYHVGGENIGWNNYPDDIATAGIQSMFMGSPDHKANILGSAWDVIGIGAYKGPDGKKMWTVLFADKCGSAGGSTPKPTPRPTPRATARPTARPTSRPAPRPTPRPTPRPQATAQAASTAAPTATPTASPTDEVTPDVTVAPTPPLTPDDLIGPTDVPGVQPSDDGSNGGVGSGDSSVGMRVVDRGSTDGLLETIVGGVAGFFFGG